MTAEQELIIKLGDDVAKLIRKQELIYDISFNLGNDWIKLDPDFRGAIMDHLDGSRGLKDLVVEWANEFDSKWESFTSDMEKESYYEEIDKFAYDKFSKLCAELGKQRLTRGTPT